MAEDLVSTLADLKEEEALAIAQDRLNAGDDPLTILNDARRGMEIVGKRFAKSEYFIPDLVYSGEILKAITEMVKPKLITKPGEVKYLGVDVPPQRFVQEIEEFKPDIVGLSGLLTLAYDSMKETIKAIGEAGLRDKVKIMIGGGVIDETIVPYVGADGFEQLASGAPSLAKKWIGGK